MSEAARSPQHAYLNLADSSEETGKLGQRRQQTRLRLIKGAAQAFAQNGLEATTVADILNAAGVSRRTFYQFFADKQAVLVSIYERSTAHLVERMQTALNAKGSGFARLQRSQQVYLDIVSSDAPLIQILTSEALRPASPLGARRLWLHQHIEDCYRLTYRQAEGKTLEPLAVRGLILFTETLILHVLTQASAEAQAMAQVATLLENHLRQLTTHAVQAQD